MKITTKVSFKEYVKLLYSLAYERIALKLLVAFAFLLLLWIVCYQCDIFNLPKPLIYQYITLVLIAIGQPLIIFITIRQNYYSSNHLMETLEMELTENEVKITGQSYYMEVKWKKLFRIEEKPNWFLLYQNNLSAIIIPKKVMTENQIEEFRQILKNVDSIPVEL